jgi:hypothetical protein
VRGRRAVLITSAAALHVWGPTEPDFQLFHSVASYCKCRLGVNKMESNYTPLPMSQPRQMQITRKVRLLSHFSLNEGAGHRCIFSSKSLNNNKIFYEPTSDMVDLQTSLATDSNLGSVVRFNL